MPRPVKPDRPVIAEPVVEPIQGTTIVVIHAGSSVLRIGRTTDHYPHSIPHVIARKITGDDLFSKYSGENLFIRKGGQHAESDDKKAHGLRSAKTLIQAMRISGGHRKPRTTPAEVASYNSQVHPTAVDNDGSVSWTDVSAMPNYIIGEKVLSLPSSAPYSIRWPMAHGQLNIHSSVGGSITSIAADLQTLWGSAIETYLEIPVKDLNYYRAVLLIPDIFERAHVKVLVDVLLNRLKFSCVIVGQESVCGAFGSGLPSACVVDVGAEKTSICCVEDGISLPSTRVTLNYGGNDITRCFYWLLKMANFPYRSIDTEDQFDAQLLQELKETFCHLSMEIPSGQVHEFQVVRPNENIFVYKLRLGDEPLLAPTSMFVPDLFGIVDEPLIKTFPEILECDPEDLMDHRYLLEKRDVDTKKAKGETENESQEFISLSHTAPIEHAKLKALRLDGMPLDEAIMYSIEQCSNQETKRKMYGTVLLIGGGMNFKGTDEFLLKRLQSQLPPHYHFMKEQMEVITRPKENDPRTAGWKGGTVLSILDSSQELWISQKEWNQYGVRILRERCAFQWSTNMDKQ